jgi:hypothetical protein
MNFYWVGLVFWLSLIISIFIGVLAIGKKSPILMLLCFLCLLPFCTYFFGGEGLIRVIAFVPLIPLILALYFFIK